MPSGAKKRKAARRKKEMEMGLPHHPHHPPLSPTTLPHGNGHERESASEDESDAARTMDRSENGAAADDAVVVVKEVDEEKKESSSSSSAAAPEMPFSKEEAPPLKEEVPSSSSSSASDLEMPLSKEELVSKEGGEVTVEFVEVEEKVEETPIPQSVIVPFVQVNAVNEQVAEVLEAQAEQAKEAPAAVAQVIQEREVAVVATEKGPESVESFPEVQSREIAGTSADEVAPAPLAVHRANWWNCCGLLDVFSGSQR